MDEQAWSREECYMKYYPCDTENCTFWMACEQQEEETH